jgi:release factor glutamine methyltransferase
MTQELWTIKRTLDWTKDYFQKHGIPGPRFDAEILMAHLLSIPRIKLYTDFERPLSKDELSGLKDLIRRRIHHEPIAYILGHKEFYTSDFSVNPSVLIPRPETELIVDELRRLRHPEDEFTLLDIGTGSGCLAISAKKIFPKALVTATDISDEALEVAKKNGTAILGSETAISFLQSDLFGSLEPSVFDVILCNPPYIPERTRESLAQEVKDHEPSIALFGGEDGMEIYRRIFSQLNQWLATNGIFICETGVETLEPVKSLAVSHGFTFRSIRDLQGMERHLVITRKS